MQWKSIETAPKDGTEILLIDFSAEEPTILVGKWDGDIVNGPWRVFGNCYLPYATHWIALQDILDLEKEK